jgi:hypothetical protein
MIEMNGLYKYEENVDALKKDEQKSTLLRQDSDGNSAKSRESYCCCTHLTTSCTATAAAAADDDVLNSLSFRFPKFQNVGGFQKLYFSKSFQILKYRKIVNNSVIRNKYILHLLKYVKYLNFWQLKFIYFKRSSEVR